MYNTIEKISIYEFMLLIILYEVGTAIVVIIGAEAKQDAWLAVIIATALGLILFYIYYRSYLMKNGSFYELLLHCLGKKIGTVTIAAYTVYFIYLTSRVLRDFNEVLLTVVLPNTPIEFSSILFMGVVSYVLYLGFEVFSRTTVIFAPYLFLFLFAFAIFLIINSSVDLSNLQPVLSEGFKPVLKSIFPSLLTFPFGELIVFTIIFPQVVDADKSFKPMALAILTAGILITCTVIINISVLRESGYLRTNFPLLTTAREISIADFIERLDPFVVFIVMLGVFVKVSVYLYCALKGMEAIYKKPYRYFSFPIAMIAATSSVVIAFSLNEHLKEGLEIVPLYLHVPMQILIPMLIFVILLMKSRKKGDAENDKNHKNVQKNRGQGKETST
ncbi:GerAB/ArcD/ProY family transporter [Cytobacillus gottheilii]|uniref:GerAB/ArcD/ProY family transporter n=1 Tax=Cytobacillus gottheilii TaxID=859144 RepID=A0ABX8FDG4_9BACI|nr:GerAB/ArcD/ProY family transporter [Cytobacillus gottheilii]QVY62235.1 GerAB/ArcD/ProY family transporter [Cytobacillus gottheilii]